jgi:hypothetical protein
LNHIETLKNRTRENITMKLYHESREDHEEGPARGKKEFQKKPLLERLSKSAAALFFTATVAASAAVMTNSCSYDVNGIPSDASTQDGGVTDGGDGGMDGGVTDGGDGGMTDGGDGGMTDGGVTDGGDGGMTDGGDGGGPLCAGVHEEMVTAKVFTKAVPDTVGGYSFEYTTTGVNSATFDIRCGSDSSDVALGQVFTLSVPATINVPADGMQIIFNLTGKNSTNATADVTVQNAP